MQKNLWKIANIEYCAAAAATISSYNESKMTPWEQMGFQCPVQTSNEVGT